MKKFTTTFIISVTALILNSGIAFGADAGVFANFQCNKERENQGVRKIDTACVAKCSIWRDGSADTDKIIACVKEFVAIEAQQAKEASKPAPAAAPKADPAKLKAYCVSALQEHKLPVEKADECAKHCETHPALGAVDPDMVCAKVFAQELAKPATVVAPKPVVKVNHAPAACKEHAKDETQKACKKACAFASLEKAVACAKRYGVVYKWEDDGKNRKLISAGHCGGKICIGRVSYPVDGDKTATRLAVCGSENCGNDSATECALQSGYGSKSFDDSAAASETVDPAAPAKAGTAAPQ